MRNDYNSKYLEHHGILGMHWGERNGPPYPLSSAAKSASEKARRAAGSAKEGYKKARNIAKSDAGVKSSKAYREARRKNIDDISTDELKKINNRLNAEQQYQRLTSGQLSDAKRFVGEMSKNVAAGIITGIAIEAGKKFVKHKLGI